MMKKLIALMTTFAIMMMFPATVFAEEEALDFVKAKAVVLMCMDTGDVLYQENELEHLSPASVTKIMTILLILEALDNQQITLSDTVTASPEAVSMGGSQIWLEQGETMTVEELLKAVIIASANDACTALAEYVGGSTTGFVKMMNDRAAALGLENTNFENCNGLDDTTVNHYSCAYDLAVISREVMKHEELITKYSTVWLDSLRDGKTELNNTNKLVNTYNGITGLKTGTTSNAGFCVAATATRDNMHLVAVVLGSDTSEDRFNTAAQLLDWGFANYELVHPEIDSSKITDVKVLQGEQKSITPVLTNAQSIAVKRGSNEFTYEYSIKKEVTAPVKKGDVLGTVTINDENGTVGKIDVLSPDDVLKLTVKSIFNRILSNI